MDWVKELDKMVAPVLEALSQGRLQQLLPTDFHPERAEYVLLEAFGRSLVGMAPWLELSKIDDEAEATLQSHYRQLVQQAFVQATEPSSPDYMNFSGGGQPLVDAAFLAHFIVRAPNFSKEILQGELLTRVIAALKTTRRIMPPNINWNLFSAMIEGALAVLGADYDLLRVIYAIRLLDDWYVGDGIYGDGPRFHCDYYNSFVMQPMALDLLDLFAAESEELAGYRALMVPRFTRFAAIQERSIGPDGTYPLLGRSIVYRCGAFQALAQAALQDRLPTDVSAAQVRGALSAVISKVLTAPGTYDGAGWLQPGVYGQQAGLAESYMSVGSLYLATTAFLPLGLPADHPFWQAPAEAWTAKKVWLGEDVPIDQSFAG